ncbi:conserved Plasmodium protein, unknown function [Plasmodium berghei]|uniref:Transcription initiation factor IIF subunit alpha n=2 Tax=Plasmodium berghei TaxID=5821 RepID=A0A509APB3_PLABA|nr:conserved protein, unknown function [Plasmodium berghei ANKA]CXI90269.1 conserved Plasmodium protein, unknown function [Plasmodium berghei]SCL96216.1 conserved Plasmodium protein, unknown function [Plasmodium berghei]SCM16385.1 conserved Plasmodium protein, unknown function [Plasmodium berghei]SCM18179.1 conserved Plasmodium protein, unknown function [Plasmodium berghei]SCN27606.1 conserved Plasmodium protein, unknown function [Plasmodium berghei]|eukprot:XP_034423262.1 conserved protein, unknown function [Plasmodium berghei ANKA]
MNEENDVIKHSDFHLSKHGNKRIRINKINDNVKYIISRFTNHNEIDRLTPPVTFISKDENPEDVLENEKNDTPNYWLLKNTSTDKCKINHKSYVSKKCNLNTDVFFVLIENEDYSELYPVSNWQVFEPDLSEKALNVYNPDITQDKLKAEKNNKRLDEIIERLKNKEESMKINLKTKDISKKKTLININHINNHDNISNITSAHSGKNFKNYYSSSDDDLGLKRQEKKRLKNLYKLKKRENKDEIDYVDSALSITEIRKNKSSWDYNDDGKRSDDEDLYMQESAHEFFDDEDENEESDNNSGNEESILTSYGQAMKSLLKQQINDEEDDELNQYSDDEDEEDDEENDEDNYNSNRGRTNVKSETNEKNETNKIHNINEYIKEKIRKNEIQLKKENCAKILLKIIEKNNGKMDILTLLDILNIKEKNQNFILVQKYIKELCIISSQTINNKKVKMVAVKPKYLSKK